MHIDLFPLFELQGTGAFSWVQLVRKLFLAALNCNSKWHLKRRAVILTSFMKRGFSHHIFPDNNTSIVLFIKSSSNQRHCLFSQDTIHSVKKPTAVCLFVAFYCKLLNLWRKCHLISESQSWMKSGPVKLLHHLINIHILLFGAIIIVFCSCASSEKLHVLGGKPLQLWVWLSWQSWAQWSGQDKQAAIYTS